MAHVRFESRLIERGLPGVGGEEATGCQTQEKQWASAKIHLLYLIPGEVRCNGLDYLFGEEAVTSRRVMGSVRADHIRKTCLHHYRMEIAHRNLHPHHIRR